jgi:urease accessory protein
MYPLVMSLALSTSDSSVELCLQAVAFAWCENMVQAAIKAIPLGQSAGQRILSRLTAHIPDAVQLAQQTTNEQRQIFSPMLAILSAQHETQYSRLFRS